MISWCWPSISSLPPLLFPSTSSLFPPSHVRSVEMLRPRDQHPILTSTHGLTEPYAITIFGNLKMRNVSMTDVSPIQNRPSIFYLIRVLTTSRRLRLHSRHLSSTHPARPAGWFIYGTRVWFTTPIANPSYSTAHHGKLEAGEVHRADKAAGSGERGWWNNVRDLNNLQEGVAPGFSSVVGRIRGTP